MILKTLGVIYHTSLYSLSYSPKIVKTRIDNFGIALIVISLLLSGCTAESEPKPIEGCMDELATNFDINADVEDGSCEYADSDGDGVFDINEIVGCTDSLADNYDENATDDDGSCLIPWESQYGVNWVERPGGEDCECSDGSEWTFWTRDADPERVILYFQGGGACWEDHSCKNPGGTYKTTVHDDDPNIGSIFHSDAYGIGNFRNSANPIADWSWIYVPYCTGDVHLGFSQGIYSDNNVSHHGHANAQFAYSHMLENYPNAQTILVTGSSAGSIPSPFYGAQASLDYPDAKIMVFNDGSGGLYTNNTYDFYEIWNMQETVLDFPMSSDLNFNQMDSGDLAIASHDVNNDIRFARFTDSNDETMRMFSALLGNDMSIPYKDKIMYSMNKTSEYGVDQYLYMAPGNGHTILLDSRFYSLEVNGVIFADWFTSWINEEPIENVLCQDC